MSSYPRITNESVIQIPSCAHLQPWWKFSVIRKLVLLSALFSPKVLFFLKALLSLSCSFFDVATTATGLRCFWIILLRKRNFEKQNLFFLSNLKFKFLPPRPNKHFRCHWYENQNKNLLTSLLKTSLIGSFVSYKKANNFLILNVLSFYTKIALLFNLVIRVFQLFLAKIFMAAFVLCWRKVRSFFEKNSILFSQFWHNTTPSRGLNVLEVTSYAYLSLLTTF